jgi:hypothetical protein
MSSRILHLLTLAVIAGCTWQGTPVPVSGDLRALEGEWDGTYGADQSGRTGSIHFVLTSTTDSAFGDVLMDPSTPRDFQGSGPSFLPPAPRVTALPLKISFVRADGDEITGRLEPYEDPITSARLSTTFRGIRRGDLISGEYTTLTEGSGRIVTGTWSVERRRH